MLKTFKNIGRAVIPKSLFRALQPLYHGSVSWLSSLYFGHPSKKMVVIGITGTAGKTTTSNMLAFLLSETGHRAGFITTANYSDGHKTYVNQHGLSMPGGFLLQEQLKAMVDNGCTHAVIEATSEGLAQNRHLGIHFDMALFTNLSPAHIDNHGSFENYREAKGQLFLALSGSTKKYPSLSEKIIGANLDDLNASYFLHFPASHKFGISLHKKDWPYPTYVAENIVTEPHISFATNGVQFHSSLFGEFNLHNALMAVAAADKLGVTLEQSAQVLPKFTVMSGRMEEVENTRGIKILVDYGCEPQPMREALDAVQRLSHRRLIAVFGTTGGHRDVSKRFEFGEIAARVADTIIITNDDVYDSDPEEIARNIQEGIDHVPAEQRHVSDVIKILDRRSAIRKALEIAQPNDIVIFLGKSSEQFLVLPGNKRIAWEEKKVVAEELQKL